MCGSPIWRTASRSSFGSMTAGPMPAAASSISPAAPPSSGRGADRHRQGAGDLSRPRRLNGGAAAAETPPADRQSPCPRRPPARWISAAWALCRAPRWRRRGETAPDAGAGADPGRVCADNQPTGQVDRVPVPPATHLYVQVGAFSKLDNAKALLAKLGGDLRISALQRNGQTLYRVRTGPLNSVEDADAALVPHHRRGQQRRPYRRRSISPTESSCMRRLFLLLSLSLAALAVAGTRRDRHQRRARAADGCGRQARCCGRRTAWCRCRRRPCPS